MEMFKMVMQNNPGAFHGGDLKGLTLKAGRRLFY